MTTNYEKACQMVGEGAADTLKDVGLLAADPKPEPTITAYDPRFEGATPTHWKIVVCAPKMTGSIKYVHSLPQEFKDVIQWAMHPGRRSLNSSWAEKLYQDETSAQRMATMAKNAGLDVRLMPCYLVVLANHPAAVHHPN